MKLATDALALARAIRETPYEYGAGLYECPSCAKGFGRKRRHDDGCWFEPLEERALAILREFALDDAPHPPDCNCGECRDSAREDALRDAQRPF